MMPIISMIPLLIIVILLLIKKVSVKKIFNAIFWGIISLVFAVIITSFILPIFGFSPTATMLNTGVSLTVFIMALFTAAIPEEISKFICIKFSNSKDKSSIIINAILIGVTFACIENIIYISGYSSNVGLTRLLQPGHLFFQLVMASFMIKALTANDSKKMIFNVLSIIVPVLCHTLFNTLNSIEMIYYIFCVIGVLTYIYTFFLIIKLPKEPQRNEIKMFALKLIGIIVTMLFVVVLSLQNNDSTLNQKQNIKEDNIEMTVLSTEKEEIKEDPFSGNYIKVKVEIKNNSEATYIPDMFHFHITDNLNKNNSYLTLRSFDDCLMQIEAGKTSTGYLYFEDEGHNYTYLIYTSGELGNTQTYSFNIK